MSYSFLRESKLYIVYGGNKYRIYTTSAIAFNQTFAEDSYSVKTLHDQSKMFEDSNITKANPAAFSFEVPLTLEIDDNGKHWESIVIDLLSDVTDEQLKSFKIYVQTGSSTFKLESAIITNGSFDFIRDNQFIVRLEGQGTRLTKVGDGAFDIDNAESISSNAPFTIDESPAEEFTTRTPLMVYPVITADSLNMDNIISVNLQIQNNITWTPFETLHKSLSVANNNVETIMFPATYTLENRTASGEIRQYQKDTNITQFDDFSTSTNLTIKAIQTGKATNATPFFQIQLNPVKYTARMDPAEVYTQSYDYRSLDNTALGTRITQYS